MKKLLLLFPSILIIFFLLFPYQQSEDDFIIIGGGPPSVALYIDGRYVGGVALNDVWPNYTMYDGFLWGNKLIVTIPEVSKWVYIFYIPDFSRPAVVLQTPGNVSHFLYYRQEVAPLSGGVLWLAAFNTTEKRGYLCPLDLTSEVLEDCLSVGLYPHAPILLRGSIYTPLIREPYIVVYRESSVERRLISMRWSPYVNSHAPLRFTYFSFHMITTDGVYIYGEGHPIEPGYLLSPITIHAHSYIVAMDLQGNVVSYFPTSALPPGLPGLAVCKDRLFATSPLEGSLYILATPHLKPLRVLKLGKTPWGVFANRDCSRIYVTDILGGAVYVINVDNLTVEEKIETPMAWPHTVIFINRDTAAKLAKVVTPRIIYNFTYFPPVLACGDLPPPS